MQIDVLEIKEKKAYLIRKRTVEHCKLYVNGGIVDINSTITISKKDTVQYQNNSKVLVEYRRGEEVMSIDEYKSKPQYYYDESTDEAVLRAIANKKELEGYKPIYEEPKLKDDIEYSVIGFIEDTGSNNIGCTIKGRYSKSPLVYTTYGQNVAMDEYKRLMAKYQEHADFEKPDRPYLRFTKINDNYVFYDGYLFGDYSYIKSFTSLDQAKNEESNIKEAVAKAVKNAVFKKSLTENKRIKLISQIKLIKKLRTRQAMVEVLDVIIADLSEYKKEIDL